MQTLYICTVIFINCVAAADLLRGVDVPLYAFAGGQATLSCSYDLSARRLYSLKWYHNGTEFYRYVPTERNKPINIKPSHKFSVTEVFRNEQRVTLSLTRLAVSASGQYRCEVIAEHPSFRTEASTSPMTVLKDENYTRNMTEDENYSRNMTEDENYTRNMTEDVNYTRNMTEDVNYTRNMTEDENYTRNMTDENYTRNMTEDVNYTRNMTR
ncbi:uncharacterized protein [Cherax quadricarinatus]|uniref:uncharacterized protein n=1 Tax=Cherax quadricarinatus TaxID=27406 RepID=UPI00387EAA01